MVSSILVIPDTHAPYHHPDTLPFLEYVKSTYGPFEKYVHLGDETDGAAWKYHEVDPGLDNPDREFANALEFMHELYAFTEGKCNILESNHGSLAYRKARTGKIPNQIMRQAYERALNAPPEWAWHPDLVIETPSGPVLFLHGIVTGKLP